ncbi:MAG: hypothetical protein ACRDAT_01020 [Cetobacterium sp.]
MNIGILEKALKEFIEKNTEDLMFPSQNKKDSDRPVKVYTGFLPPNTAEDEIPVVVIRFNKGEDLPETRFLEMDIYFGIYNKDSADGYTGLLLLIQRVLNRITEEKYIGEYFAFEDTANFEILDEQPYPYWLGSSRLKFAAPKPSYTI